MNAGSGRPVTICLAACLVLGALAASGAPAGGPPYQFVELAPTGEVKGAPDTEGKAPAAWKPGAAPFYALRQGYLGEVEPNNTFGTATPLGGTNVVVRASVFPNADVDYFSFPATAGDRVSAAVMTSFSANSSSDSQLRLFGSDGTTLIEFDEDDGTLGGLSSTIAGATIPTTGTYYLAVQHFSTTNQLRPYDLHVRVQSGSPTPETEANDTPATANPLPANGWVSGTRNPAVATEQDWFSLTLNAGDTVYLSLDLDPERDNVQWNGRLGIGLFGDASNQILVVDDASTGSVANPLSEALFFTVKDAGTYYAFVDSATAATGGPTATYHLSVSVHPATDEGINCTVYTSTNVPQTIGPGAGLVSSTITVPGNPRIADLDVQITLTHALMADLDVHLRSPAGNDNGIFSDIGAAATGGQTQMDLWFDDEAGITPGFTVMRGVRYKPELAYRLSWFDGEDAGGTWTLDLRDDGANASGGTLTAWSIRVCEPPPPPVCPAGFTQTTVFSTDFESGAAGFTHSGTADEWELGLPAFAPITTCNSGVNCWKTDLDNTYNASSSQDLLSPPINLAGFVAPVVVTWAQRFQIENASFDHASVDFRQVGGATPVRLFEWQDATMTDSVGNPTVTLNASAGWALFSRRADSLAGTNTELAFHLDSDNTVQLAGLAIDDVTVTACAPLSADLSITKTDGVATATPGGSVTYTIVAANAGPAPVAGATVADTFPATLTCTWTCVGAGGGTCTAAGAGNINDSANLPAGASATYTASCAVSISAVGSLVNTATVTSGGSDPNPANNSATDTDTLLLPANLVAGTVTVTALGVDPYLEPGDSGTITLELLNNGQVAATAISATLTSATPGVTITGGTRAYPDIPAAGSALGASPFTFTLEPGFVCGTQIAFVVTVSYTGGVAPALAVPIAASSGAALPPPATASGVSPLCQNATATATVTTSAASPLYLWSVTNETGAGAIVGSATGASVSYLATSAGVFSLTCRVKDGPYGCEKIVHYNVTVLPASSPVVTAPAWASAGATGLVASVADNPGSSYLWTVSNGAVTGGQGTSSITFSVALGGSSTVTVVETNADGCVSKPARRKLNVYESGGPCEGSSTTLCLNNGRFKATVAWTDYTSGQTGSGKAVQLTNESGYFWFLAASNTELFVKVLDGTDVNGHYWTLFGALSDMEYTLTVEDTVTGVVKTYANPAHVFASRADVAAFPDSVASHPSATPTGMEYGTLASLQYEATAARERASASRPAKGPAMAAMASMAAGCAPDAESLCLTGGRFEVRVQWKNYTSGQEGMGRSAVLSGDSGYFWFFGADNLEIAVKVLDGTAINGKFWVFYASLTDVEFNLTVKDTETLETKTYYNPPHNMASTGDVTAF